VRGSSAPQRSGEAVDCRPGEGSPAPPRPARPQRRGTGCRWPPAIRFLRHGRDRCLSVRERGAPWHPRLLRRRRHPQRRALPQPQRWSNQREMPQQPLWTSSRPSLLGWQQSQPQSRPSPPGGLRRQVSERVATQWKASPTRSGRQCEPEVSTRDPRWSSLCLCRGSERVTPVGCLGREREGPSSRRHHLCGVCILAETHNWLFVMKRGGAYCRR
jgi:hypothetical protein